MQIDRDPSVVVLLIGPPGSGKGTQSRLLGQWLGVPSVSTGDMLRGEVQSDTALGRQVAECLEKGRLVGDELVNRIVAARLGRVAAKGVILDGYPRTLGQARHLDEQLRRHGLPGPVVIHLEVPREEIIRRLSSRRQCSSCERVYNLDRHPPAQDKQCDHCGAPLFVRSDDEAKVISLRLEAHQEQTGPLLGHYGGARMHRVDGNRQPNQVFREIRGLLEAELGGAESE